MVWGSAEDIGRRERRLRLVFYCSTREENMGLDLGELRDRRVSLHSLLGFWQAWPEDSVVILLIGRKKGLWKLYFIPQLFIVEPRYSFFCFYNL